MDFRESTRRYERWLATVVPVRRADLAAKHRLMRADALAFLRGTFYRWAQLWPGVCRGLAGAPRVLAVGDLHIENFGTWRDAEGRLAWGVNDFDETVELPYTQDLVRLAASALLAGRVSCLHLSGRRACKAILAGYAASLAARGGPVVLAERHRWLRDLAVARLKDGRAFWERLAALPRARGRIDTRARKMLSGALPPSVGKVRLSYRRAGVGSLGRLRLVALADWHGGLVAREMKALAPSAWLWADGTPLRAPRLAEVLDRAVRIPDPFLSVREGWLVRRLAPDCSRIDLASLPRERDERRLLWMMGWETANVHLGTPRARRRILDDLGSRRGAWLAEAARRMVREVEREWTQWRLRA